MSIELEKHISQTYAQISDAASKADISAIQRLTRKITELEDLKQQQAAIQQRVASLISEEVHLSVSSGSDKQNGNTRELYIQVTSGMIRQNLLTLTPHIKRGKIKIGEELIIEVQPSGERFHTIVMDKGNKLRARGEIAHFYKETNVQPDNYVVLTEISPGRWTLKKAPHGFPIMPKPV